MAFTFKGQQVDNINYNGQPLDKLQFNGVTVWEKAQLWKGLKFTANSNSTITFKIAGSSGGTSYSVSDLEYSMNDGASWSTLTKNKSFSISTGQSMCVRGTNAKYSNSYTYHTFAITGSVAASGNIMSLINKTSFETLKSFSAEFVFYNMFYGCTALTSAPELPATTLTGRCYCRMFYGCSNLTKAPELPATTTVDRCYYYLFYNCSKLKEVTVRATAWNTTNSQYWMQGVASGGTFYNLGKASISTGTSGIPSGWTVKTSK